MNMKFVNLSLMTAFLLVNPASAKMTKIINSQDWVLQVGPKGLKYAMHIDVHETPCECAALSGHLKDANGKRFNFVTCESGREMGQGDQVFFSNEVKSVGTSCSWSDEVADENGPSPDGKEFVVLREGNSAWIFVKKYDEKTFSGGKVIDVKTKKVQATFSGQMTKETSFY